MDKTNFATLNQIPGILLYTHTRTPTKWKEILVTKRRIARWD